MATVGAKVGLEHVLVQVPHLLDFISAEHKAALVATSWDALVTVVRFTDLVIQDGPHSAALLRGLALRLGECSHCSGSIDYGGLVVPAEDAAALLSAFGSCSRLPFGSGPHGRPPNCHREEWISVMHDALTAAKRAGRPLRVTRLAWSGAVEKADDAPPGERRREVEWPRRERQENADPAATRRAVPSIADVLKLACESGRLQRVRLERLLPGRTGDDDSWMFLRAIRIVQALKALSEATTLTHLDVPDVSEGVITLAALDAPSRSTSLPPLLRALPGLKHLRVAQTLSWSDVEATGSGNGIWDFLKHATALEELDVGSSFCKTEAAAISTCGALSSLKRLKSLTAGCIHMRGDVVLGDDTLPKQVGAAIGGMQFLQHVSLGGHCFMQNYGEGEERRSLICFAALFQAIANTNKLRSITVDGVSFDDDITSAFVSLLKASAVEELALGSGTWAPHKLTDDVTAALAANDSLREMSLWWSACNGNVFRALIDALHGNRGLVKFKLAQRPSLYKPATGDDEDDTASDDDEDVDPGCTIGDICVAVPRELRSNTHLLELHLTWEGQFSEVDEALGAMLRDNRTLTTLRLHATRCRARYERLADALAVNDTLRDLFLLGRVIPTQLGAVADGVRVNRGLEKLHVERDAQFQLAEDEDAYYARCDDACTRMGRALEENSTLRELCVGGAYTDNYGAERIAPGLLCNTSLEVLELRSFYDPQAQSRDLQTIANALRANTTLKTFVLTTMDSILVAGAAALASAIQTNRTLRKIANQTGSMSDAGAALIARAVKSNDVLEELDLSPWPERDTVFQDNTQPAWEKATFAFADCVRHNRSLRTLKLFLGDWDGEAGPAALLAGLERNTTLTHVEVCPDCFSWDPVGLQEVLGRHGHRLRFWTPDA